MSERTEAATTDIVERLRSFGRGVAYIEEAADEIERLTSENAELRYLLGGMGTVPGSPLDKRIQAALNGSSPEGPS